MKNRNQYNEAIDQWARDQGGKAYSSQEYRRAALAIYDDYEKIKNQSIEHFEALVNVRGMLNKKPVVTQKATTLAEKRDRARIKALEAKEQK